MMWRCDNCNKENKDERVFCWNCSMPKDAAPSGISNAKQAATIDVERPTVCVKCFAKLDEDSKFCPECAAPVLLFSKINCRSCGKLIDASAKFCKFCAADLTQKVEAFQYSSSDYFPTSSSKSAKESVTEKLLFGGAGLAAISAVMFLWGYSYVNNLENRFRAGLGGLVGQTDSTYQFAGFCVLIGAVGFIVGATLLGVGLYQKSNR